MNFYLFEKSINSSRYESSKVLISRQILQKCILSFGIKILRNHLFPITPKHRVSLARPSLSIGKHRHIIPLGNFTNGRDKLLKYLNLRSFLTKRIVKLGLQHRQRIRSNHHRPILYFITNNHTSYSTETTSLLPD